MNLKQRIGGLISLLVFIVFLTYISINSIVPDAEMTAMLRHRQKMLNISVNGDVGNGKLVENAEYRKYALGVEKLKIEVHRVKKKFLLWKDHLKLNRQRKNISMDIMNQGDQKSCKDLTLLFMVSSELSHLSRRQVIRSTWLNQTHWREYNLQRKVSFEMIFIVGRSSNETAMKEMREESKTYGDLLILDLEESFYSLSYKVMIGFQWITENCPGYKYLLKGDDDIFVNIHASMTLLHEPTTPENHLYIGNSMSVADVVRNGRYGVSREEYKRDNYPRYNSGGGFVLSSDVVRDMIPHFDWITPLKIDDAFMGGLILKAGIDCRNDKRFRMFDTGCVFRTTSIVSHTNDKIVIKPKCATYLNDAALKDGIDSLKKNQKFR